MVTTVPVISLNVAGSLNSSWENICHISLSEKWKFVSYSFKWKMLSMKNVVSSACNSKITPVLFSLKNEETYFGIQVECLMFTSYAVKENIENVLKGWGLVKLLFLLVHQGHVKWNWLVIFFFKLNFVWIYLI